MAGEVGVLRTREGRAEGVGGWAMGSVRGRFGRRRRGREVGGACRRGEKGSGAVGGRGT